MLFLIGAQLFVLFMGELRSFWFWGFMGDIGDWGVMEDIGDCGVMGIWEMGV